LLLQGNKNNDCVSKTTDLLGELLGEPKQEQEQQQQQPKQPEPPSEAVAEVYRAAAAAAASPPRAAAEEPASGRSNPVIAGADANLQVSLHAVSQKRRRACRHPASAVICVPSNAVCALQTAAAHMCVTLPLKMMLLQHCSSLLWLLLGELNLGHFKIISHCCCLFHLPPPTPQVSKEVIEQLRRSVFGFDTMWVTSVENYEQVRQQQQHTR
jgi:hypothetical protein